MRNYWLDKKVDRLWLESNGVDVEQSYRLAKLAGLIPSTPIRFHPDQIIQIGDKDIKNDK
jgi:hypothetical protein